MVVVPLGLVNALMNLLVWAVHAIVTRLSESIYARASAWEVSTHGRTTCTDAAEITPSSLLLGSAGPRLRRGRTWWVLFLLTALSLLIPLELLVESGISKDTRCRPYTVHASKGVCASEWNGHSEAGIAAAALLVQRFEWVDREWEVVLEGSAKSPRASEVRTRNALRGSRRVLAADCTVSVSSCVHCGNLWIERSDKAFHTVVSNASEAPEGRHGSGDLTYDKEMMLAFYFWEGASIPDITRRATGGRRIYAHGVETLMSENDVQRVIDGDGKPWWLSVNATREGRPNARMYNVSCVSDGFTASNFTQAISLFRTAQMEQPGVRRANVRGNITNLPPLTASDAAKAVFAMKAEDWSPDCSGDVDVYSECGRFSLVFVAPFFAVAAGLVLIWVVVRVVLHGVKAAVPHDAQSWRRKAHEMARTGGGRGGGDSRLGTPGLWMDRGAEAVYDPSVFVMLPMGPPGNDIQNGRDAGLMSVGAVPTSAFYGPSPRFEADR